MNNPARAQEYLESLTNVVPKGYCIECQLKPSKEGGYIQVSSGGANKFCVLGEMVAWAKGVRPTQEDQVSHLCHRPTCVVPAHVTIESARANNARKGCRVWVDCPHCPLKIFICDHQPACIRYAPGYSTWEEFRSDGVH